jgi:hypothetical protein
VTENGESAVYTLLVEVGRQDGDGLPDGCDGAALLCYVAAATEEEAVRAAVETLRTADLSPLSVESHGTEAERVAAGHEIDDEHRALMTRAEAENAVIVAQMVPFEDEEEDGDGGDGSGGEAA